MERDKKDRPKIGAADKETPPRDWRSEEARRIVEEYANDLREIIKILQRRLFN